MVVRRIRSLDPPGQFLEQGEDNKYYRVSCDKRILEKTCQALREKSCGAPSAAFIANTKAERSARAHKRRSVTKQRQKQQTSESMVDGHRLDSNNGKAAKKPLGKHASGSRIRKLAVAAVTPLKVKKPSTPKAKTRAIKVTSKIRPKDPLPRAKKEVKFWKKTLKDVKTRRIESTLTIPSSPAQANVTTRFHLGNATLATYSTEAGFMPWPCMPPHLSSFFGAVFQPRMEVSALTYAKPTVSSYGTEDCTGAVVNDDAGLAILEPPQLEAKHSLCIDDHKKDLEVINDFDPVAAWNSFAVQKKEQW